MRSTTAAALIVPLAILLGCGGDDASSESAAQPMAKAEFIAEADRLCTKTGKQYDALVATLPPPNEFTALDAPRSVLEEVGKAGAPLADIEARLEGQLRSLTPPAAFATRWDTALYALRARAELVADAGDAAEAGDRAAFLESFQRFAHQGTVGSRALGDYGFEVCGQ
jgi:hypothetical protein